MSSSDEDRSATASPVQVKSDSESDEVYKPKANTNEFKLRLKEDPVEIEGKAKGKAKAKAKSNQDEEKPKRRRRAKPKNPFVDVKTRRKGGKRKPKKQPANQLSADGLTRREQKQLNRYDADSAVLIQRHHDNEEMYLKKGKFIYIATTDTDHDNKKYKIGFTSGPAALRKYSTTFAPGLTAYFICPGDKSLKTAILQHPKVLPLRQRNNPTLTGGVGRRSDWIVGLELEEIGELFSRVLDEKIVIPVYPFA